MDDQEQESQESPVNWPSVAIAALTFSFFAYLTALCAGWRPWA